MKRRDQGQMRKGFLGLGPLKAVLLLGSIGLISMSVSASGCLYPDDYTFDEVSTPSTSSSSGNTGSENCLNGLDDDKDGQVDCADSDCASPAFQCVAAIPIGWQGYFALYEGAPGSVPNCPADFPSPIPYEGNNGLVAPPATCAACTCGGSTNEACDLPNEVIVTEKSCAQQGNVVSAKTLSVPPDWDGSCYSMGIAQGGLTTCGQAANETCNKTVKSVAATTKGGSCTPSGGDPTIPPATWMTAGKACGDAPKGGGCSAGEACQPAASGGFKSGLCIVKDGEQGACPGAPFTDLHVFYKDVMDTRGCEMCGCTPPAGGTCTATIELFSDANCTMSLNANFNAGNCVSLGAGNPAVSGRKASGIFVTPGTCTAQGGMPTGMATPSMATTFCCIP